MTMNKLSKESQIFWDKEGRKLPWAQNFTKVARQSGNKTDWFIGGKINPSSVCIDWQVSKGHGTKTAIIWESETGEMLKLSYNDLLREVNLWAACLKRLGAKKGDIITIYMPMIPQAIIAMLACTRLGAVHNVVFSGFSPKALRERIEETSCKLVISCDISYRRGKKISLKENVDQAVRGVKCVKKVLIFDREKFTTKGRSIGFKNLSKSIGQENVEPEQMDSNDPIFILYTSGSTGKPKGIVHRVGGYLVHNYSIFEQIFDFNQKSVYWCSADIGWITGHSYVTYAPLMHGLTIFLQEGTLDYPDRQIWYRLIKKHKIDIFYTSPTAIRMLKKFAEEDKTKINLPSLRQLGSVGEPINKSAWQWFHDVIGQGRCPIADTWWQTETGGVIISPRKDGPKKQKPGSATKPLQGLSVKVLHESGRQASTGQKGYLVIDQPWPGMTTGIYKDQKRFINSYLSKFKGCYLTGDFATRDKDGDIYILGRFDDVIKVAGHRFSSPEIESVINLHPLIAESAAIGFEDSIKGEQIIVFAVKLKNAREADIESEIKQLIVNSIGKFAAVSNIIFIDSLPKTRSGKIMRRLLKAALENKDLGDVSTLEEKIPESVFLSLKKQINS